MGPAWAHRLEPEALGLDEQFTDQTFDTVDCSGVPTKKRNPAK